MNRRISVLVLLCAMLLLFAGCGRADSGELDLPERIEPLSAAPEEREKEIHIGVTMPTDDDFSENYLQIFSAYARENGAKVTAMSADNDPEEQIRQVEDLIAAGCDVIYCRAVDADRLSFAAEYARDRGVPFIGAEFDVNSEACTTHLLLDESAYGYVQGLCVVYLLEQNPELVLRAGHLWVYRAWAQEKQRWDGFCKATEEFSSSGRLLVLDDMDSRSDNASAIAAAETWLREYPEMNCILANNDTLAYAVGSALQEKGVDMEKFFVIGVEGTREGLHGVQEGVMYATAKILDDQERIEYFCSIAIEAALGHAVEKSYAWSAEGAVVTSANVTQYLEDQD